MSSARRGVPTSRAGRGRALRRAGAPPNVCAPRVSLGGAGAKVYKAEGGEKLNRPAKVIKLAPAAPPAESAPGQWGQRASKLSAAAQNDDHYSRLTKFRRAPARPEGRPERRSKEFCQIDFLIGHYVTGKAAGSSGRAAAQLRWSSAQKHGRECIFVPLIWSGAACASARQAGPGGARKTLADEERGRRRWRPKRTSAGSW